MSNDLVKNNNQQLKQFVLFELQKKVARRGIHYALDRLMPMLNRLNHPEKFSIQLDDSRPPVLVIHVAGTNGKGSVCHYLTQACIELGLGVFTYTSPHILEYTERFCLNGEPLDWELFCHAFQRVNAADYSNQLSEYEALTLMAFLLIQRLKPAVAIIETGLGGRLDATNVIPKSLGIITDIGLDHCDILGNNIDAIAVEKAGIIKPNCDVVTHGDQHQNALNAIHRTVQNQHAQLHLSHANGGADVRNRSLASMALSIIATSDTYGVWRRKNAIGSNTLAGIGEWVRMAAKPPFGRQTWVQIHGSDCMLDVGHNAHAVQSLLLSNKTIDLWVIGMQKKKDLLGVLQCLIENNQCVRVCNYGDGAWDISQLPEPLQANVTPWNLNSTVTNASVFFGSFFFIEALLNQWQLTHLVKR